MKSKPIEQLDPKDFIIIKGAKLHNLKSIDVAIPRNKMVVVTGLSGSGKSSLIFDTLFAEGQRRYVESLSSYARQFLTRMKKPEVDYIKGLSPAIAIEQKITSKNPRSTVGTTTEIYDYLKLLFARIGKTISPISGKEVKKNTVSDVVDFVLGLENKSKIEILSPLMLQEERTLKDELSILLQKGFTRLKYQGKLQKIQNLLEDEKALKKVKAEDLAILIDRFVLSNRTDETQARIADSAQTAFFEGHGFCLLHFNDEKPKTFSNRFELDEMEFEEPSVNLFSFNNPYGVCRRCEGFGTVLGIDENLVFPDKTLSVYEGAIAPWRSEKMSMYLKYLINAADAFDFPIHRPYFDLSEKEKELLWTGNKYFDGLNSFFKMVERQTQKIQYRVMLSRYRGRTNCPDCKTTRLRKDASYVKLIDKKTKNQLTIIEAVLMPVWDLKTYFENLELNEHDATIAKRILVEIKNRLGYLCDVGLGYLTLNRMSKTLSGGESQRIKLATSLGSNLVGSLYILDEPSIGLHPRDNERLVKVLENLKAAGNTVIIVEHEESVMKAADELLDIGPEAGTHGGKLMFQGSFEAIKKDGKTLTGQYLSGKMEISIPRKRRVWSKKIEIFGASENNLKNIDVEIPLNVLSVVTGVSGSGKTSLIKNILYSALRKELLGYNAKTGKFNKISGDISAIKDVEMVDQNPIGKSSRSNPVTYTKAYDAIRNLLVNQPLAKMRGYKPGYFSFNTDGGRCEICKGDGTVTIEMQFLADVTLECESCRGKRFKEDVLEITYKDKNISDILNLTVSDAISFFEGQKSILNRLQPLKDVGLGYVTLGQSSSTLSGGEAQRIKLASYLTKGNNSSKALFIFDEPTTGLHFHDIKKLLFALNALIENGNTVVVIEHNAEIIKSADWVLDLGPEGGNGGGKLVFAGTPEDLVKCKKSYTGAYLKEKILG